MGQRHHSTVAGYSQEYELATLRLTACMDDDQVGAEYDMALKVANEAGDMDATRK